MSAILVSADTTSRAAGFALIRITGAAAFQDEPGFQIRRSADWAESALGPSGWQVADATLIPDSVIVDGADLVLRVGPDVCLHVEVGVYGVSLPAAEINATAVWPEIDTVGIDPTRQSPPPSPPPPPPPPDSPSTVAQGVQPIPIAADESKPAPSRRGIWLALGAVLLVAAGGLALALTHPWSPAPVTVADQQPKPPPAVPPTEPEQPPAPSPPSPTPPSPPSPSPSPPPVALDTMSVKDLITRNNPGDMTDQAQQRLASHPQEAMLLLETAGDDRNHGPALALLAQLYDPNKPRRGGIGADARQAAKYYRQAQAAGQSDAVAADREALRAYLDQRRQAGDLTAKLTLQDFWP
ncbi:MAG: hypothetical protein P4M00_24965 [Azospirillaceae bacterium]|nr:hypothetical protein [Azospirillaceae bacterium]